MSLLLSMLGLPHRHRRLEAKISLLNFIMGLGLLFPRLKEQDLLDVTSDEFFTSPMTRYLPWTQAESNVGSVKFDEETFQVNLDVPESVKAPGGFIVIEETKQADGYAVPEGCNPEADKFRLSSEGVPSVNRVAPKKEMPVSIFNRGPVRWENEDLTAQENLDDR